jgi:uncharacterized lipoprotein
MRVVIVAAAAAILGGCAFSAQPPIVVKPELVAAANSIGANRAVYLNVVDERPSQSLGTRGVRGVGAELTVADLTGSLRAALSEGLKNRGFSPTSALPPDGRQLKVEIRDLQYNMVMGFWAGTLRTQCSLKAICRVGPTDALEKLFRGVHEESVQVVQGAEANIRYVNDAVSKAVNELLADPELDQCLASSIQ